ncbi:hypothetical protein ACWXVT_02175 [Mycoplasma sp. 1573]
MRQYVLKVIVIIGFMVGIQLFSVFISRALNWLNSQNFVWIAKFIGLVIISIGGAVATKSANSIFAEYIGESASAKESLAQFRQSTTGALAIGGGLLAGTKAIGGLAKGASPIYNHIGTKAFKERNKKLQDLAKSYRRGDIDKDTYKIGKREIAKEVREQSIKGKSNRWDKEIDRRIMSSLKNKQDYMSDRKLNKEILSQDELLSKMEASKQTTGRHEAEYIKQLQYREQLENELKERQKYQQSQNRKYKAYKIDEFIKNNTNNERNNVLKEYNAKLEKSLKETKNVTDK